MKIISIIVVWVILAGFNRVAYLNHFPDNKYSKKDPDGYWQITTWYLLLGGLFTIAIIYQ